MGSKMPPSPAMRISPGRELMRTGSHKRGHSLESGILYHEKDDDLALFDEVQNKERENFLLQSNDDFDDLFPTKLRGLSNNKLGISIPTRRESRDLLNTEGDKNDYDWLITPPETPLFSSLDDEAPPVNLATRGRPRSQPIPISRSPTMEKGYRSGRGSASPHRLSPSPRSSNSTLQSRSRPFSATHSSPPPILRHSPSRGLSPPPSKPKPSPRSSTPTPGRMSTGSTSSRVRGTSPIKTSRGNSASPKLQAWQSNIPGFSTEAPPNLRTSLADRPASYVRGSSPASSRNGSRAGRQSMSPTASRSVSSSHSHDRDPFSSNSKGSVASSGDDDMDSLQSIPISSSDFSDPRSAGAFSNSRVSGFSKKQIKSLSSSVPKRSFDLALRQMERKGPPNMFRPLLSSVPSATFYAGNAGSHHRSLASINSSFTTSSNASSDQATSGALDTEESEQNHEDVTSDCVREQYPDVPDEVFVMDQSDEINHAVENRALTESTSRQQDEIYSPSVVNSEFGVAESQSQLETVTVIDAAAVIFDRKFDYADADSATDLLLCSRCGCMFLSAELVMESEPQICLKCKSVEISSNVTIPIKAAMGKKNLAAEVVQVLEHEPPEIKDTVSSVPESFNVTRSNETGEDHLDNISGTGRLPFSEPNQNLEISLIEEQEANSVIEQVNNQKVYAEAGNAQFSPNSKVDVGFSPNSKVDVSEGAGISLLLKRSCSGKRHIVQSRSFTASNISYDDFSYVTDSMNSMRTSFGHSSASVTSSIDLGHSRPMGTYIQRQLSSLKSETDFYRYEVPTKHRRSSSSLSGTSSHVFQAPGVTPSYHEDSLEPPIPDTDKEVGEAIFTDPPHVLPMASEFTEAERMCTDIENNSFCKAVAEVSEGPVSHENYADLTDNLQISIQGEEAIPSHCVGGAEVAKVPKQSSLDVISEMNTEKPDVPSGDSHSDDGSTDSNSSMDESLEPTALEGALEGHNDADAALAAVGEIDISDHVHEESSVVLEDLGGVKDRSMMLDEAADAILSSIVHDLTYEAANKAKGKETPPVEVLRPTVPFVSRSNPDKKGVRSRTKHSSKSQKARPRKLDMDMKPSPVSAETNEKPTKLIVGTPNKADSTKPPKLESKCNCTIM